MRILAVIPTFNEADNILALIDELLKFPGMEVLVVDDRSPDGTAKLVGDRAAKDPRVRLIERTGPAGRGLAGRDGFLYALERRFDAAVEMDADFSHQPSSVPKLLEALGACDMAVGSRFVSGGTDLDRPIGRRVLTVAANAFARGVLGLPVLDCNSGFRAYTRRALEAIEPASLRSTGPSIVHEVLFRAARAGLRIKEVPIEFIDRKKGASKLTLARLAAGYLWILRLRLR